MPSSSQARWILDAAIADARHRLMSGWLGDISRGVVLVLHPEGDLVSTLSSGATNVHAVFATIEESQAVEPLPANAAASVVPVDRLPFDDNSVDVAVALRGPVSLDELSRVLRPDGSAVVAAVRDVKANDRAERLVAKLGPVESVPLHASLRVVRGDGSASPSAIGPLYNLQLLVAGGAQGRLPTAETVSDEALVALLDAVRDLENRLAEADVQLRRLRIDQEHLREVRELLVAMQADAAEAVELRFERKLFALEIADLEERNRVALERAEALTRRVRELEASTSWKVTGPLRRLSGAVRR